jgi:hypothetical protein
MTLSKRRSLTREANNSREVVTKDSVQVLVALVASEAIKEAEEAIRSRDLDKEVASSRDTSKEVVREEGADSLKEATSEVGMTNAFKG